MRWNQHIRKDVRSTETTFEFDLNKLMILHILFLLVRTDPVAKEPKHMLVSHALLCLSQLPLLIIIVENFQVRFVSSLPIIF